MTAEQTLAATALNTWKVTNAKADKFFSALTDEQLQAEVAPGRNRLIYLYGHLIAVHDRILPLLGLGDRLHPELDTPFLLEAENRSLPSPSAADLKKWWDEVNGALLNAFERLSAADWVKPHTAVSAEDFAKNPLRNRLSVLLSRTTHVDYHLGQAALAKTRN
jgi:DinB superfamily